MNNKDKSNFKLIARLINFMKNLLPFIIISVFFALGGFIITLVIPATIVSLGLDGMQNIGVSKKYLLLLIALAILRGLFRYGEHYFGHYVAFKVLADFRSAIFSKLRRLAPSKLDSQDSGVLLKLIGEDVEALEVFFAHTLAPVTTGTLAGLILFIYFASHNILSAFIATATYVILAIVIPKFFSKKLRPLIEDKDEARKDYSSYFLDSLKGMKDLLQLRKDRQRFSSLNEKSKMVNKKERRVARLSYMQFTVSFLVIGFALLAFAMNNFILIQKGNISFKHGLITLVVFSSSFAPFLELSRLPLGLERALQAARQTFSLLDEKEAQFNLQASEVLEKIEKIDFKNVSFAYDKREEEVLKDISLKFQSKKIIGLAGESGSGKTTLMKLIMKWYGVNKGLLELEGKDIRQIDGRELQKKIAYIPQSPQLFSQTIRENIVLSNNEISDEMILDMAESLSLKDKILSSEKGLDTMIDSENIKFSSGEQQRLELIRAFLKKADVYIFDEPTSNLDSLNEAAILQAIKKNSEGMVFLISHRMTTLSIADIVYVLDKGRLIGTHTKQGKK